VTIKAPAPRTTRVAVSFEQLASDACQLISCGSIVTALTGSDLKNTPRLGSG